MQMLPPTWRAHVLHGETCSLDRRAIDVDVSHGQLDERGWARLCALGADVESLRVASCNLRDEDLRRLRLLPNLRRLELADNPITDAGLAVLADHEWLSELSVARTEVRGAGLAALSRTLQHLDATGAPLDDLAGLAGRGVLRVLAVTSPAIDDAQLEVLGGAALVRLSLRGTGVNGAGLAHVAPRLQHLDLGATRITREHIAQLARFAALSSLDLSTTHVGPEALTTLPALRQLRDLDLRHTPLDERDLEPLVEMTRLRELTLCDRRIPSSSHARLKKRLSSVGPLKFVGCDLGADRPCKGLDAAVVPILRSTEEGTVRVVATGVHVEVPTSIITFGNGGRIAKHADVRILLPKPSPAASTSPASTVFDAHRIVDLEPVSYRVAPDDEFEETSTPLAGIQTAAPRAYHHRAFPSWRRGRGRSETLWADDVVVLRVGECVTLLAYPHGDVAELERRGLGPCAYDAEVVFAGGGAVMLRLDAPADDELLGAMVVSHARFVPELAGLVVHVDGVDVTAANHGQVRTAAWRR